MKILTVTGLDANVNKSVGKYVSEVVDRLVDRRLLKGMSWMRTNEKLAFQGFQAMVDAIKGEIGFT